MFSENRRDKTSTLRRQEKRLIALGRMEGKPPVFQKKKKGTLLFRTMKEVSLKLKDKTFSFNECRQGDSSKDILGTPTIEKSSKDPHLTEKYRGVAKPL